MQSEQTLERARLALETLRNELEVRNIRALRLGMSVTGLRVYFHDKPARDIEAKIPDLVDGFPVKTVTTGDTFLLKDE